MKRFLLSSLLLAALTIAGTALAQDVTIAWKDLSAGERNRILNEWRALDSAERGPFIQYRDKAIAEFDETKKAQHLETAKERIKRKTAIEKSHKEKQAKEKINSAATLEPIAVEPTTGGIKPITPIAPAEPAAICLLYTSDAADE